MIGQTTDLGQATIGDMLTVAIELEAGARRFYEGLAEMFAHIDEVAAFWRLFAADEAMHGSHLAKLRASLNVARLSEPANAEIMRAARKLLTPTAEEQLAEVRNLDDAYEIAHDLETSETNTIFRFMISEFSQDRRIVTALMRHLDEHVERLMTGLPARFATRAARAEVKAVRP